MCRSPRRRSLVSSMSILTPGTPATWDGVRTERVLTDAEFRHVLQPRVTSTKLALAWVAAGRRADYVTTGDLRDSVHFSAGIALCQAAGL